MRNRSTSTVRLVAAVALVGGMTAVRTSVAQADADDVLLAQGVPGLAGLQVLHPTDPSSRMQIGVSIGRPDPAGETALAAAMYDPTSPRFHHFLTPSEFSAQFGVPPATTRRIVDDVTSQGLTPAYTSADGNYVLLNGTAQQVERTFGVQLNEYRGADGSSFRAAAQGATAPAGVSAVLGLDDISDLHTHQTICRAGECVGTVNYADLWSAYGQPPGNLGLGVGVGIFGEGQVQGGTKTDTFDPRTNTDPAKVVAGSPLSDLRHFEDDRLAGSAAASGPKAPTTPANAHFRHTPVRITLVNDDLTKTDGTGEWDLDQAAINGMAPDIESLSYYFGTDLSTASIAGTYSAWDNDAAGPVIGNSSFGGCENLQAATGAIPVLDGMLQQATMLGRTMFVSTGDVGGSCGVGAAGVNGASNGGQPQVEYPASSPYVVAVGGTVIYTAATSATVNTQLQPPTRSQEIAWSHTGGGTSFVEPKPTWQNGISTIAGVCTTTPSLAAAPPGQACRGVPDVASMSGDIITNQYEIYSGSETTSGGTSLSSPLWAGMWARVAAAHPATCASPGATGPGSALGFAAPVLYSVGKNTATDASSFFDVSVGSNVQQSALPRSTADPSGWDYVSGLGVPTVAGLIDAVDCHASAPVKAVNASLPEISIVNPTAACPAFGTATDDAGDSVAISGLPGGVGSDSLDLLTGTVTNDATALHYAVTVKNLSVDTTDDHAYEMYLSVLGTEYDLFVDNGNPTGPVTYQLISVDPTTGNFTTLATLSGSYDIPHNRVQIDLPYAAFNAGGRSGLLPGSTVTHLHVNADRNLGGTLSSPSDEMDFGATCPFTLAAFAGTTIPETTTVPLLAVTAGLAAATFLVFRRRRSA